MAIIDFFDRGWRANPEGVAYIQGDTRWRFNEAGALSCQIANRLLAEGFAGGKGAVWAGNDVKSWLCTLGLWRANMAWIPVNARSSLEDTLHILRSFDCEILFYQGVFSEQINAVRDQLPAIKQWVCIDGDGDSNDLVLDQWLQGASEQAPAITVDPDDVVMLSPTGGTTGLPKGVMNTHRSAQTFVAHFMMACHYAGNTAPVNLAAAPMTHTAGLLSLPCTARGGTVVVLEKPDAGPLLGAIVEHRVSEFFLPPTVIYRLLDIPGIAKLDFSSLRYFMYGAAPMSVDKLKKAIEVFGPVMTGGYGQTEAPASIAFLTPAEHFENGELASDDRLSSVGRPNPLIRVEIFDDNNRILPQGESGEICVRGDLLMKGYYKAQQKTAETLIDGWLHTGDIGHLDSEGYLHITDRKKDLIISGGFNVYPSEVEQVIWGHPAVQDCAVIGVPDAQWGESVKAVIELSAGQTATEADIIALCKDRLGSVKAPKSVEIVDSLPRSAVGKVLKKDLRERYWTNSKTKI